MSVTIPYTELHGSPVENWDENGFRATRQLKVAWAVRNQLAAQFLVGIGELYEPMAYIPIPARALKTGCRPILAEQLGVGTVALYEFAQLTVEYGPQNKQTDQLISESWEPTMEYLTLDYEDFVWPAEGGDPAVPIKEEEAPGRIQRGGTYVITLHQVYTIPLQVLTYMGSVNKFTVIAPTLSGLTFPPETLLYTPPTMNHIITTDMAEAWRLTYAFSYKETGWNTFWRQDGKKVDPDTTRGTWSRMYHKKDPDNPYLNHPLLDFAPLGLTVVYP